MKKVETPKVNKTAYNLGGQGVAGGVPWCKTNPDLITETSVKEVFFFLTRTYIHACTYLLQIDFS